MAPLIGRDGILAKRYCDYNRLYDDYDDYNCRSAWDNWGRWVAAAVVIFIVLLIAIVFSCINSRRRRRLGMQPRYGTGWMAKPPAYNNNGNYYAPQPGSYYGAAPAPPYTPAMPQQETGNTFNSNDGYYGQHNNGYGGQQGGIELQSPQHVYSPQRGGDPVYEAPYGPPPTKPGKGDGFVR